MALSREIVSNIPQEGHRLNNIHHLGLLYVPQVLNPQKLLLNLRHPIGEGFHTSHNQYPVDIIEDLEYHVVEHKLFKNIVTVDVVHQDSFAEGLVERARQLFRMDFYYGHVKFFPQPFKLVDRTFVGKGFNLDGHVEEVLKREKDRLSTA